MIKFLDLPIIRNINRLYSRFIGTNEAQITPQGTPKRYAEDPAIIGATVASPWLDRHRRDYVEPQEQLAKYVEADLAILLNPQLKQAIRNYAYGAAGIFQGCSVISAPNKAKVEDIFIQFIKRTKLKLYLPEIFRRIALYGNGFLQRDVKRVGVNQAEVQALVWMPVYGMIRCSNDLDQFDNSQEAYKQVDISRGLTRISTPIGIFPEWAIDNIKLFALEGQRYGHSLIESTLYSGANARAIESLINAYWTRKFSRPTDVHALEGPENMPANDIQLKEHINRTSKARISQRGEEPPRDLYITKGSINRLPGDANTDKITDIELLQEFVLAELQQSPQMISADRNANVGVLVERFRQLYASEEQFTTHVMQQLKSDFDFELALHGISPDDIEYKFQFGQQYLIQDLILVNREARADYQAGQISLDSRLQIASQLYRFDTAIEKDKVLEQQSQALMLSPQQKQLPSATEDKQTQIFDQTPNNTMDQETPESMFTN